MPSQWGYRHGKSTGMLLLLLTKRWREALDNGFIIGILLIDFQKAFDTINHGIMAHKLQACGILGQPHQLLFNYLTNRKQFVQFGETKSGTTTVMYGAPQGSLIGPPLFAIYINDLTESVSVGNVFLHADDTTFYYISKDIEKVRDVGQWCENNQMSINTDKSEVILITKQGFISPLLPVKINTETIKYVNSTIFLGILRDNHLK